MSRRLVAALTLSVLVLLAVPVARAAEPVDGKLRSTIEEVVRDYLRRHPEVVGEALQQLEARQREQQLAYARAMIAARRAELVEDRDAPVGGNPAGTVSVVAFLDYRCTYCKAVEPTIQKLVAEDRDVRLVYKEFPILGPDSLTAAKAALAAHAQGKYETFHAALMGTPQPVTGAQVFEIAARAGLDVAKLKVDMESAPIRTAIERNHRLAETLGITGTPSFVIGSELVVGVMDLGRFKELVAKARTP